MRKLLFTIAFFTLIQCLSYAQTSLDNFSYQVYYQTTSTDTAVFDSLCTRVCKVSVDDVTNLAFIKVKVGTTEGASDILQYDFAFDIETGLPLGLSYNRDLNIIYLGLLETYTLDIYYYEIRIEDSLGNLSTSKRWN